FYLSHALFLPKLHDIETTPSDPIHFKQLAALRPADSNRIEDPDAAAVAAQAAAYPDIAPMDLERSASETFDMVHEAAKRLGWTVVLSEPPEDGGPGQVQATDPTPVLRFTDPLALKVPR